MNYQTSPNYSIPKTGKKVNEFESNEYSSPGPMYNTFGMGQKHKSTSNLIGKSKRTQINHRVQKTPGPNQYDGKKILAKEPQYSIPQSVSKDEINTNPDPFWYQPITKLVKDKVPQYSMGSRYPSIMNDLKKNPGPGDYNPETYFQNKSMNNTKNKMFGTAKRFSESQASLPGPGLYQIKSSKELVTSNGTIGKGQRQQKIIQQSPGPADYPKTSELQEKMNKKIGKSISGRFKPSFIDNQLTSSAYNKYFETDKGSCNDFKTSKKYSIGKDKRQIFPDNKLPGPTDYINDNLKVKTAFHATMTTGSRDEYNGVIKNPGPGTYKIQDPKGNTYSIPRSQSLNIIQNTPGVGRYKMGQTIDSKGGLSIGKAKRTNFISNNKAGVGDYEIIEKKMIKGSFGKAGRFNNQKKSKPGPGDYHILTTISNNKHYTKQVKA